MKANPAALGVAVLVTPGIRLSASWAPGSLPCAGRSAGRRAAPCPLACRSAGRRRGGRERARAVRRVALTGKSFPSASLPRRYGARAVRSACNRTRRTHNPTRHVMEKPTHGTGQDRKKKKRRRPRAASHRDRLAFPLPLRGPRYCPLKLRLVAADSHCTAVRRHRRPHAPESGEETEGAEDPS